MKLFDEHVVLRVLLLIVGALFALFERDLVTIEVHRILLIPYSAGITFLFCVALFYSFRSPISLKRMRKDVDDIEAPTQNIPDTTGILAKLQEQTAIFDLVLGSTSSGFWVYDIPTGKIKCSPKVAELLGLPPKSMDESKSVIQSYFFESDWADFSKTMNMAIDTNQEFTADMRTLYSDSVLAITGKPQRNEKGNPIRVLGSVALKQISETKKASAYKDELTGLRNRRYFQDHLANEATNTKNYPEKVFALVLIDIEHFGQINNMYSEKFGDALLKIVGNRISCISQKEDCVARLSGDLFGVIIHDLQSKPSNELVEQVQRIQNQIKTPVKFEDKEILLSASISVITSSDVETADSLFSNAMVHLHNLKNSENSGTIKFFTSGIREKAMNLYKMEIELRKAILAKDFTLVYQPVIDIFDNNKVVSFEALVRWNSSERGMVPPSEFIPLAEDSGLIVPLGELILRKACEQAKRWVDQGFKDLRIAVNFSAKQFAQENLIDNLQEILNETELNPHNLKIEITEYTAMSDSDKTVELMRKLTSMGLEISIDDFGTGFSSLSYLKKFPVNTLKIDKSFVDTLAEKEEDAAFVKMIIGIAKSLNLDIIAEGVETKEQLDFLYSEGCRCIQGYYFSKPLPPEMALEFLKVQNAHVA